VKYSSSEITLPALLNGIDGVSAQGGHILIMSTKAIEQLDNALPYPWRVDMEVHFGYDNFMSFMQPPLGTSWVFWTQGDRF
ncbi:hypothetical protein ASPFODRAFT_109735, partial [Aspergillus luchuensis CBS 106.47]